jgi:hypothetical protein
VAADPFAAGSTTSGSWAMKNSFSKSVFSSRGIKLLIVVNMTLMVLDFVVHHHGMNFFLPDFARYLVISFSGCLALIFIALCLAPLLSRRGDYYDE